MGSPQRHSMYVLYVTFASKVTSPPLGSGQNPCTLIKVTVSQQGRPMAKSPLHEMVFHVQVVVLPMAPLGPLRKCLCSVVLSTSLSHIHLSYSFMWEGVLVRLFVGFVAML